MAEIFKTFVNPYELLLTARKDDRSSRVVSTCSLKIDDPIAIAINRRSDISPFTMRAVYENTEGSCSGRSLQCKACGVWKQSWR
jgi:hypothetical protein